MMIEPSVTPEQAVAVLNELFESDPAALRKLADTRTNCNKTLAEHPTCQVRQVCNDPAGFDVGMLGILNAIFGCGVGGQGYIAADYNVNGELVGFTTLTSGEVNE